MFSKLREENDNGTNKSLYSESLNSYLSDYNSPSESVSNVSELANTYKFHRKLSNSSQTDISFKESQVKYKNFEK